MSPVTAVAATEATYPVTVAASHLTHRNGKTGGPSHGRPCATV